MPLGKDFSFDIRVNRVTLREYESKGVVYVENEELLDPLWHLKHLEEVSNSKNNLLAAPNCKVNPGSVFDIQVTSQLGQYSFHIYSLYVDNLKISSCVLPRGHSHTFSFTALEVSCALRPNSTLLKEGRQQLGTITVKCHAARYLEKVETAPSSGRDENEGAPNKAKFDRIPSRIGRQVQNMQDISAAMWTPGSFLSELSVHYCGGKTIQELGFPLKRMCPDNTETIQPQRKRLRTDREKVLKRVRFDLSQHSLHKRKMRRKRRPTGSSRKSRGADRKSGFNFGGLLACFGMSSTRD